MELSLPLQKKFETISKKTYGSPKEALPKDCLAKEELIALSPRGES